MSKILFLIRRRLIKYFLLLKNLIGIRTTKFRLNSGENFVIRNIDHLGLELMSEEFFELKSQQLIMDTVQQDMVVLDIGANIGFYTVKIANKIGAKGKVFSFEPNPEMVKQLTQNVQLNKFDNVFIQPVALSDSAGVIQFHCPEPGYESHGSFMSNSTFETSTLIDIKTQKLDDWLESQNIKRVDFIKIDVEGAERKIFSGASRLLSSPSRPTIIFECAELTCAAFGHCVYDVLSDLVSYGYVVSEFDCGNWVAKPKEKPTI